MSWKYTPISYDFHYTLASSYEAFSEWRTIGIRGCDGDPLTFIHKIVADLAIEKVRSRQASEIWYHGVVLGTPYKPDEFSGNVYDYEGEVCLETIGGTGVWVDRNAPAGWQDSPQPVSVSAFGDFK